MTSPAVVPPEIGAAGFEAGRTLHFPCFDAFRFFGMTMVLLAHASFATDPWVEEHLPGWLQAILARMDVGVAVFFMISGFLLFRPFVARQLQGRPPGSTRTFFRRRMLRVVPGYWFALTACVVVLGQQLGGVKDAFLYYFLLFPFASTDVALGGTTCSENGKVALCMEGDYAIPQAWSLTAEFAFYFVLPLVAILMVRWGARKRAEVQVRNALLICGALYLTGQLFRLYFLSADPSWARVATIWPPNWVDFFAIGMAMAVFSVWEHGGGRLPRFLSFLGDHPVVSWVVAGLVVVASATFRPPSNPGEYGAEYFARWFMFGVFSFFLLAPVMFGDQTRGRARRVLASRPLVYLGTVSLGFYLFHLALMTNIQEWLAPAGTSGDFYGSFPVVFGLTFAASIAAASVSYLLVERPFLRLKDRSVTSLLHRRPANVP